MKKVIVLLLAVCLFLPSVSACGREENGVFYEIKAVFRSEGEFDCSMSVDYINVTEAALGTVEFNLFPAAFRQGAKCPPVAPENFARAYPDGESYGGIEIKNCTAGGKDVAFSVTGSDENILSVPVGELLPGDRVLIGVDFALTVPKCKLRFGRHGGVINLGNFYPILCAHDDGGFYRCDYRPFGDPFYSECADYKVVLEVPGEYTVAAGGKCDSTEIKGTSCVYTFVYEGVRDVAFSLSKDFEVSVGGASGTRLSAYSAHGKSYPSVLKAAEDAMETFTALFGECPYKEIAVVTTPFVQGGMEYPALVYISDALGEEDAVYACVHEIAHQWWYAAVGNNEIEYPFLDEGLAEYSTVLFYENNPSYGRTREQLIEEKNAEFHAFYGVFEQLTGKCDTRMTRSLDEYGGEYEYVEIAYTKGALMFDSLRTVVGDARFFKGLKRYYGDFCFGIATPDDLIASFLAAGCDAEDYIGSWLSGKAAI